MPHSHVQTKQRTSQVKLLNKQLVFFKSKSIKSINSCVSELRMSLLDYRSYMCISDYDFVIYSQTSMARTSLRQWKFVRGVGCSRHWGFIIAPSQEANGDYSGKSVLFYIIMVCWVYSLESPRWGDSNEYTQHTISWENRNNSQTISFLSNWKNFVGTQKRVRISHSKRAIGIRAIEVRLY